VTDFLGGTEAGRDKTKQSQLSARLAREAAIASAYEPLVGLKQLGEVEGGGGRVWVGADGSPALGGFAPLPDDRQRFLQLCRRWWQPQTHRGRPRARAVASTRSSGPPSAPTTAAAVAALAARQSVDERPSVSRPATDLAATALACLLSAASHPTRTALLHASRYS
jgi:hypothetical protein